MGVVIKDSCTTNEYSLFYTTYLYTLSLTLGYCASAAMVIVVVLCVCCNEIAYTDWNDLERFESVCCWLWFCKFISCFTCRSIGVV